ncbi:DUF3757 domain-containing protein [Pseudomonas khavaziana]|uniref:DUF3757 domain-containing protein n=1 Tax=Pseudomonas khavaziana TaxID=2842351 RepID=UPI001C3DF442|nr:DUF3757 domain-containing protein [Pseudomonas khavaziana]MBV4479761.1 DUF3757 domain-containing protein [Pseudomonas khavaziana]
MRIALTAGAFAMLALTGNAYAATATCPPISTIKQTEMGEGGYSYSAPGPNGLTWEGENKEAKPSYLDESKFTDAKYKDETKAVICSYEGSGDAGVRVALKPVNSWAAAPGTQWNDDFCKNSDISKCSFIYN